MKTKKVLPKDTDLTGVEKALKRAARNARELAVKSHTHLYVFEDGKVVDLMKKRKKAG